METRLSTSLVGPLVGGVSELYGGDSFIELAQQSDSLVESTQPRQLQWPADGSDREIRIAELNLRFHYGGYRDATSISKRSLSIHYGSQAFEPVDAQLLMDEVSAFTPKNPHYLDFARLAHSVYLRRQVGGYWPLDSYLIALGAAEREAGQREPVQQPAIRRCEGRSRAPAGQRGGGSRSTNRSGDRGGGSGDGGSGGGGSDPPPSGRSSDGDSDRNERWNRRHFALGVVGVLVAVAAIVFGSGGGDVNISQRFDFNPPTQSSQPLQCPLDSTQTERRNSTPRKPHR